MTVKTEVVIMTSFSKNTLTPWQPTNSQGSFLQLFQCFFKGSLSFFLLLFFFLKYICAIMQLKHFLSSWTSSIWMSIYSKLGRGTNPHHFPHIRTGISFGPSATVFGGANILDWWQQCYEHCTVNCGRVGLKCCIVRVKCVPK